MAPTAGRRPRAQTRRATVGLRSSSAHVVLLAAAAVAWGSSVILTPDAPTDRRTAPARQPRAPSLGSLDRALRLADAYLDGLYRPLGARSAVMAEYYGLPLRVYFPHQHEWALAGESTRDAVGPTASRFASERFSVTFRSATGGATAKVGARVDWGYRRRTYRITLVNRGVSGPSAAARVYINDRYLWRFGADNVGVARTLTLPTRDRGALRAFRYTARHGVQEGREYYRYRANWTRSERLGELLRSHGFGPDYDITAPIWGRGSQYQDGMPYDSDERGFSAYHDCDVALPTTATAYPYRSKVCSTSRWLYVALSRRDTLVPAAQAIHILNKYRNPRHRYPGGAPRIGLPTVVEPHAAAAVRVTPLSVAGRLEAAFGKTGVGVPRCTPVGCDRFASGVRTFQFGALETLLGYRYGNSISRRYADLTARTALRSQVPANGIVSADTGRYYRPAAAGGFLLGWDRSFRKALSRNLPSRLSDKFNMPPEYTGVVASNSETTLTAYAFLALYRCERYRIGCANHNKAPPQRHRPEVPRPGPVP